MCHTFLRSTHKCVDCRKSAPAISPAQIFCVGDIADTENLRRRYRRHIYASTAKMCDTFASSCESGLSRMIASLKKILYAPVVRAPRKILFYATR